MNCSFRLEFVLRHTTQEALAVRLLEYHQKTNPVLDIFRRKEYVITVDSRPAKEQVQQTIRNKLGIPPSHPAATSSPGGCALASTVLDTGPGRAARAARIRFSIDPVHHDRVGGDPCQSRSVTNHG